MQTSIRQWTSRWRQGFWEGQKSRKGVKGERPLTAERKIRLAGHVL